MEYAVIASGVIVGWILIEFLAVTVAKRKCPATFNIGIAFVGGVVAKLIYGG